MKITTKLALEYIKKNKRRTMMTIIRSNSGNKFYNDSINYFFKLPKF